MTAPQQQITEETLAAIKKAQTTGINEATGLYSYDLSGLINLIPVVTPFRDLVPRTKSAQGNPFAVWRAFMDATNSQPDPSMGFDYAAAEMVFNEQDFQARYKPTGMAVNVTQDSYDLAQGYENGDPYANSTFQTLNQVLIGDDRKQLCAQSFALAAASAPTFTQHASGGTIGAVQVYVGVAGRTGSGYFFGSGNSQGASSSSTFGSGAANSLTAATTALRGAVAYDWFQSSDGTHWFYYGTTTANTITMTKVITQNQPVTTGTTVPDLTANWMGLRAGAPGYTGPTFNGSADNGSANPKDYDGFLATLSGDYNGTGQWSQPGSGTANPSVWNSLDGAPLSLNGGTIAEIEEYLFLPLWQQVKCSPTAIMVNGIQAQEIANLILNQNSATTFLNTDTSGRVNVTAGGRVGTVLNAYTGGTPVPIEVHVSLPPGTIAARTDRVPFPQANISSVLEQRCLRDTAQFEYAVSRVPGVAGGGPRKESEIRTVSAFINRAPVAMATLSNVS